MIDRSQFDYMLCVDKDHSIRSHGDTVNLHPTEEDDPRSFIPGYERPIRAK